MKRLVRFIKGLFILPPKRVMKTFLMQAQLVADENSTCLRRKVGAVLCQDRHIVATGFNGAPSGLAHCKTCLREELGVPSGEREEICRAVHAELNTIIQVALHGRTTKGAVLYSTTSPCLSCAKVIVNAEISAVVFRKVYGSRDGIKLLKEAGVRVKQL